MALSKRQRNCSRPSIDRMPKCEKTVLSLYFYEELTLREIADVMGVHLSRVSQIKSQAILRLRSAIGRSWPGSIRSNPARGYRSLCHVNADIAWVSRQGELGAIATAELDYRLDAHSGNKIV